MQPPDQTPHHAGSDLGLHGLPITILGVSRLQWLNIICMYTLRRFYLFQQSTIHGSGSAWQWDPERQQFYYHAYLKEQPDLNYRNPELVEEMDVSLPYIYVVNIQTYMTVQTLRGLKCGSNCIGSWVHLLVLMHLVSIITKTCFYTFDPLKPHFYIVKLGFTGVYIIFLISTQKQRLRVLVRTASSRRF